MLDNIHSASSESIIQNQGLERITGINTATNPIENDKNYFIDESEISNAAFEKYQREVDIKEFSEILLSTDEKEANSLVLNKVFDGEFSIDDNDFLAELLDNDEFINDVTKKD